MLMSLPTERVCLHEARGHAEKFFGFGGHHRAGAEANGRESGHLFLFFNRRRNCVKVLYFVGDGLVIFYKQLNLVPLKCPEHCMRAAMWRASRCGLAN